MAIGASQFYRRLRELPLLGGRAAEQEYISSRPPVPPLTDQRPRELPLPDGRAADQERAISRLANTPFAESFRLLALNVSIMLEEAPHKGTVIMSAYPEDGRSLVAANLAIALAEQAPVLLIRAESQAGASAAYPLPRPADTYDDLPDELRGSVVRTEHPQVWMMAADQASPSNADRLLRLVQAASRSGMFTVVDPPPATMSSDAFRLAQVVGQVLYVVRHRVQDMDAHHQVREQLRRLNARIIGLVLNEA